MIKTQVGNVNILINNAGIMNQAKLFMDLSENEILNIFNVNILSQFWMIREFLPRMLEENKGHIVNVSSSLGMVWSYIHENSKLKKNVVLSSHVWDG